MKVLLKRNSRKSKNYVTKICAVLVLVSCILSQETNIQASVEQPNDLTSKNSPNCALVSYLIGKMSVKEKIGQLVMPSVRDGHTPSQHIQNLIKTYGSGSVIFYGKANAEKITKFTNQLQKWATETPLQIPLFISGDLEYGSSQHVTDGTDFPRQMAIGATRDRKTAEQIAKITAIELKAMGFNWNYSPLADVNTNPSNPVIGVRSFGENTDMVSQMVISQIRGYQQNGVVATAKHFPGHGDTNADSHLHLATVNYDWKTFEEIHLPPFKEAIAAGVDSIMTAHVIIDTIDPELPATLSKKVLTGLLRKQMGFNGMIVTDSMSMNAIDHHWGTGQAAVMAINAGADIVMATGSYKQQLETYHALYRAYKSGELTEERINESVKRILSAKVNYHLFTHRFADPVLAKKVVNNPEHKKTAAEAAKKSITVLKNKNVLPFNANDKNATTFVVGPEIFGSRKQMEAVIQSIRHKSLGKVSQTITSADPTAAEIQNAANLANKVDRVIVATYSASTLSQGQISLVKALESSGKPLVVLALGLPYDIKHFPAIGAYLASYAIDRWGSPVPSSWNAAVDVIFGSKPEGKLPVSIKGFYRVGDGLSF